MCIYIISIFVCEREKERETEIERQRERETERGTEDDNEGIPCRNNHNIVINPQLNIKFKEKNQRSFIIKWSIILELSTMYNAISI